MRSLSERAGDEREHFRLLSVISPIEANILSSIKKKEMLPYKFRLNHNKEEEQKQVDWMKQEAPLARVG